MNPGMILFGTLFAGVGISVIVRAKSLARAQTMLNNSPAIYIATGCLFVALGLATLLQGVAG